MFFVFNNHQLDFWSADIDRCIFSVVKIHTCYTPLPLYFDLPDSMKFTACQVVRNVRHKAVCDSGPALHGHL
jgi:hypothetical protein